MPTIVEAIVVENGKDKTITIDEALERRREQKGGDYFCLNCGHPVIPFREASNGAFAAHFEHKKKNPNCPLSYTRRSATEKPEVNRISGNSSNALSNNIVKSTRGHIVCQIKGIPYPAKKTRGDKEGPSRWTDAIKEQTKHLPKVKDACILKITFLLLSDKFPNDLPYGPDLDNLVKRFCDALNETIFKDAEGKDSCVIELNVIKTRVESEDESGAFIEILPIMVRSSGH